jgi:hypothetical protein
MRTNLFAATVLAIATTWACDRAPDRDVAGVAAAVAAPVPAAQPAQQEIKVAPQHSPKGDIEFKPVVTLNQNPGDAAPQLRRGQEAKTSDWPASLYVTFDTPDGKAACTAALIGPQVMLTAAHCVPSDGKVTFAYNKQAYGTSCTRHRNYPGDASADFALCSVSPSFTAPPKFLYETVNTSPMSEMVNKPIILTGYGCVSDIPGAGAPDGKYRIGGNVVEETSESKPQPRRALFYLPNQKNNLFTKDDANSANLCPGDSGGPAFVRSSGGLDTFTNRTILGVNSRVFYRNANATEYGASLVSSTGGADFLGWAQDWAKTANVTSMCGIVGQLTNCRS